jgi:hypothetical protein
MSILCQYVDGFLRRHYTKPDTNFQRTGFSIATSDGLGTGQWRRVHTGCDGYGVPWTESFLPREWFRSRRSVNTLQLLRHYMGPMGN